MHHHLDPEMQQCVEHCFRCHDVCLHTATTHCLDMGGEHTKPAHFKLMLDCAQICHVAADFMLRASPRHNQVCGLCAQICEACADDCERVGDMEDCVRACRACAESCHHMAALTAH